MGKAGWAAGIVGAAAILGLAIGLASARSSAPAASPPCGPCGCNPPGVDFAPRYSGYREQMELPDAPYGQRFTTGNRAALYLS